MRFPRLRKAASRMLLAKNANWLVKHMVDAFSGLTIIENAGS